MSHPRDFSKLTFDQMVTILASTSRDDFNKGTRWRSVVLKICTDACAWQAAQKEEERQ